MPDTTTPNSGTKPRRWTVISAGFLCGLLALVVIYTKPQAFHSPRAVVVVAAIGLAAVLAQLRFYNREMAEPVHAPTWLNVVGILCAMAALFSDVLHLSPVLAHTMVLAAVLSFAISSTMILHKFHKKRPSSK